jgi:hypothetical protein
MYDARRETTTTGEEMINPTTPVTLVYKAIAALYGVTKDVAQFVDELIDTMKVSPNQTISRTGRVIEGAKKGFGIGFITPIAIIAIGQLILGNPLGAIVSVATLPLSPVAMTCAAIGAIFYGWGALSDEERNSIIDRIREGLELGPELVKAIVAYVLSKTKELLSSENLIEFKRFIGDAASTFGKTIADITRSIKDRAVGAYDYVAEKAKRSSAEEETPALPRLPI